MKQGIHREKLRRAGDLYRAGRLADAEAACRGVLLADPGEADGWQLMGLIAVKRRKWDEASACYDRCISLAPRNARYRYLQAKVEVSRGRFREAVTLFDTALGVDPGHSESALWKIVALERLGEDAIAYGLVRPRITAGSADPLLVEVLVRLQQRRGDHREAIATAKQGLAAQAQSPLTRQVLWGLIGESFDKLGEPDDAFAAFTEANRHAPGEFVPEAYRHRMDDLIAFFSRENLARQQRAMVSDERPVIIAAMPRSGTTLVEQIIDAHPLASGAGEPDLLDRIAEEISGRASAGAAYPGCVQSLGQDQIDEVASGYLNELCAGHPGSARVVDKSLGNWMHLGLAAVLVPRARVIHCRRHPMDTCLSCFMSPLQARHPYAASLEHLGFVYRQYARLMSHWLGVLDLPVLEITYEDLVADPERWTREILRFCDLPWDERCLRFHESGRTAMTLSYEQVRRPIHGGASGRFRKYERHLGPLRTALGDLAGPPPAASA